jgi:ABC-type nitrate/sulfonate/bicarbonate transport system permease component
MASRDITLNHSALDSLPDVVRRGLRFAVDWLPILIVAAFWEFVSGALVPVSILPPITVIVGVVAELLVEGSIYSDLAISLYRIALGLIASIVVGVFLGIGMARSDTVEDFFDIFLTLLYPIPKTALVPLAILWLGIGTKTAILIVFLACLLPIVLNSYNAAKNVDQNLVRSAQMMGTTEWMILWKVVVPDTIPEILTGIRQAIPFAFIALVSAEFIASNEGVGAEILEAGQIGNYPTMFAVIILISATAYLAVRGFEIAKERTVQWT